MDELKRLAAVTTGESIWNGTLEDPELLTTDVLAHKELVFLMDNGEKLKYSFTDGRHLKWAYSDGHEGSAPYNASPCPGDENVLFLQHYREGYELPSCTTLIFDLESGHTVFFDAHVGAENVHREVVRTITFGHIEGSEAPETEKPEFTKDLVGKSVRWKSAKEPGNGIKYIFSSNLYYTYAMDFPDGDSVWMATNPCEYIKVKEGLYIASPVEERQSGFQLIMLMNFNLMTDVQSGFGLGTPAECVDEMQCWMHHGRKGTWEDLPVFYD